MAKRRLSYEIGLTVDNSQLSLLQKALSSLNNAGKQAGLTKSIQDASTAALDLYNNLNRAVNADTGKLDLSQLQKNLNLSGKTLEQYRNELVSIGPAGQQAFYAVAESIMAAELPLKRQNKLLSDLWVTMKNTVRWQVTTNALRTLTGAIETAYGYSKDLDRSLNSIRVVTQKSASDMKDFAKQANEAAKALSTTTTDYTDASLIYYQQGLDDEQVRGRTDTTIQLANVARESAEEASEQLTAIWNNFYDGSKSLQYYADVMVALGASTASSSDEIAAGIQKFAAVANTVGLSYEYAAAALATLTANTREAPEVIGNALKTLFARLQGLKLGETLDDGTDLNKYSQALQAVGVNILDTNGELKAMDLLLDETAVKWIKLNSAQKAALAQTVAGVRQYGQFISLMDNWGDFQKNLTTAYESEGALSDQADIYAESWEAARDRVRAAAEDIYDSIINPDLFIETDKALTPFLSEIADATDAMGGMKGILLVLSTLMTRVYGTQMSQGLRDMATNLGFISGVERERARNMQKQAAELAKSISYEIGLSDTVITRKEEILELEGRALAYSDQLTESQKEQLNHDIEHLKNLQSQLEYYTKIEEKLSKSTFNLPMPPTFTTDWQRKLNAAISQDGDLYESAGVKIAKKGEKYYIPKNKNQSPDMVYQNLGVSSDSLDRQMTAIKQIRNLMDSWQRVSISNTEKADKLEKEIIELANAYNLLGEEIESLPEIEEFLGDKEQGTDVESKVKERIEKIQKAMASMTDNPMKTEEALKQRSLDIQDQEKAIMGLNNANEALKSGILGINENIENNIYAIQDWADRLVNAGQSIMTLTMAIQSITSLADTLNNPDLSGGEKFIRVLTSMSMLLPMIGSSMKALNLVEAVNVEIKNKEVIVTGKGLAAKAAEIAANKANTAGVKAETAAIIAKNAATATSIALSIGVAAILVAVVAGITALAKAQENARASIEEANDAYIEEKSKLDELQSSIDSLADRMEELRNKGSLTITEKEELEKLQKENKELEIQLRLQEKITKNSKLQMANTLQKNFNKAYSGLAEGPGSIIFRSGNYRSGRGTIVADNTDNFRAQRFEGLVEGTKAWEKAEEDYRDFTERLQELNTEWLSENAAVFTEFQISLFNYLDLVEEGVLPKNQALIDQYLDQYNQAMHNFYSDNDEFEKNIIEPLINNDAIKNIKDSIYDVLSTEDTLPEGFISDDIELEIRKAGATVDEFVNYINDRVDFVTNRLGKDVVDQLGDLSAEDWEFLANIELTGKENVEELIKLLDNNREKQINVEANLDGADTLLSLLDKLEEKQDPLDKAIQSYQKQGYLEVDEVKELIEANKEYSKYIIEVNGAYKLNNLAIYEHQQALEKEKDALNDLLGQYKEEISDSKDYLYQYIGAWDDVIERTGKWEELGYRFKDQSDADRFIDIAESVKKVTAQFQNGEVSMVDYFNNMDTQINRFANGFEWLNEEIEGNVDAIDLNEIVFSSMTGQVTGALMGLNKDFKAGKILMKEYFEGTIAGTQTLLNLQQKQNNNVEKTIDGVWKLKDAENSTSEDKRMLRQLNLWEQQRKEAEGLIPLIDTLTSHYDYLSQSMNSIGQIDFSLNENFNINSEEYKNAAKDIANIMEGLYITNRTTYNAMIKSMNEAGANFREDIRYGQGELYEAMAGNEAALAGATNAAMGSVGQTIANVSVKAGNVLEKLGALIQNFDYTISFTVKTDGSFSTLIPWILGLTKDLNIPKVDFTISGNSGDTGSVSEFAQALSEAGQLLQDESTNIALGMGQGFINDYGYEPIFNPFDVAPYDEKGSSSSKKKKEQIEDLDNILERYHEITREIENQDDVLDDIGNSLDRAYGADKLNKYQQKIKELEKQQDNYNEKLRQANEYLTIDKVALEAAFAPELIQYNADGEISNYTELLTHAFNNYKGFMDQYNEAIMGELTDAEKEKWEERKELAKQTFELQQAAIEKYEETLDKQQEMKDKVEDGLREIADTKLAEIEYKLEIVLDVKSMKDAVRDFDKHAQEIFGDYLTHGFGAMFDNLNIEDLNKDQAQTEADLYGNYKQQYDELVALYESTTDDANRAKIMDDIQDLQGKVLDSAKTIVDWVNSIEDIVPQAVDAAAERFAKFTDQLEHNTTVIDTIKELYALQGVTYKTMDGFNRLQKVSQEKMEAQVAQAVLQRTWFNEAQDKLRIAQDRLDNFTGDESSLEYDALKKARDAYLEEFNEAQEAYLSSAKDAMETAQQMYLDQIERAVYEFGQAASDGIGLDLLQDKYDHFIEKDERYFDKVNEAYQTTAWFNKLQEDIDNATNSATKERLKQLQDEINVRREGNKLSQYDLDILNAKYEVLKAQMALEDAQNAKNKIELVRDRQGNWNYQYTADPDQVAGAEQDLLDAENEWYNIAKDQVTDVTGQIISTWQECQDKIKEIYSDMTLTDQERSDRAAEIYQYYTDKIKFLEEEKQVAISDMTEAGNAALFATAVIMGDKITDLTGITSEDIKNIVAEGGEDIIGLLTADNETIKNVIASNTELINLFDNVYAEDLDNMTNNTANFESNLQETLNKAENDFQNYKDTVNEVANETGTNLDNLSQTTDKVSDSTDRLKDAGLDLVEILWDMIDDAGTAADRYLELADSLWQAAQAMRDLAAAQASYAGSAASKPDKNLAPGQSFDYSALMASMIKNGYTTDSEEFKAVQAAREKEIERLKEMGYGQDYWLTEGQDTIDKFNKYQNSDMRDEWFDLSANMYDDWRKKLQQVIAGLATGGYTGEFGDEGRLAFLHQKELVLNQTDTENILSAVNAVRELSPNLFELIEKVLDGNAISAMNLMGQKASVSSALQTGFLEQIIHIDKVEFPGITSPDGLEEAFTNLANDAAQWARRRN